MRPVGRSCNTKPLGTEMAGIPAKLQARDELAVIGSWISLIERLVDWKSYRTERWGHEHIHRLEELVEGISQRCALTHRVYVVDSVYDRNEYAPCLPLGSRNC
jgi:hypothetical protein